MAKQAGEIIESVTELWQRFTQNHDQQARETLILHYVYLTKAVAKRLTFTLPPSLQRQDLVSFGVMGLLEAVDRFDPTQGVQFSTYAVPRIRGQIIDALRSFDMVPRTVYQQKKAMAQATAKLNQALGRAPIDQEVADALGIPLNRYRRWLRDANFAVISLDQTTIAAEGDSLPLSETLEDRQTPTPEMVLDNLTLKSELQSSIRDLPDREQQLLFLYYQKRLTLKQVAKVLDISEARTSQIHAKVVRKLRQQLLSRTEPKPQLATGSEISRPMRSTTADLSQDRRYA